MRDPRQMNGKKRKNQGMETLGTNPLVRCAQETFLLRASC